MVTLNRFQGVHPREEILSNPDQVGEETSRRPRSEAAQGLHDLPVERSRKCMGVGRLKEGTSHEEHGRGMECHADDDGVQYAF